MAKRKFKNQIWLSLMFFVSIFPFAFAGKVCAKIPEPDNIIYGVARDDAMTITLEVNGEQICSYTMGDNPDAGVFYVLRVPMDSLDPAQPGTARAGDEGFIYINDDTQPTESVILGERGTIFRLDLGTTDNDSDLLPDQWEQEIADANPDDDIYHPGEVNPEDDFDNDGYCNYREYLSGSHPVDTERIPRCLADVFMDGDVDGNDLAIFTQEFEEYFDLPCPECTCDMDGNGYMELKWDFVFFTEDFGRSDCW